MNQRAVLPGLLLLSFAGCSKSEPPSAPAPKAAAVEPAKTDAGAPVAEPPEAPEKPAPSAPDAMPNAKPEASPKDAGATAPAPIAKDAGATVPTSDPLTREPPPPDPAETAVAPPAETPTPTNPPLPPEEVKLARLKFKPPPSPDGSPGWKAQPKPLGPWCLFVGRNTSYKKFAKAQARVDKAKAAGLADAAIYDTREFERLIWGRLVVIGASFPDKESAKAEKKRLKQEHKLKTTPLRCRPTKEVRQLTGAHGIRPLPGEAAAVDIGEFAEATGCFAWSPKRKSLLCIVRNYNTVDGGAIRAVFLEEEERHEDGLLQDLGELEDEFGDIQPNEDVLDSLAASLERGGFVEVEPQRDMSPRKRVRFGRPYFSVKWSREKTRAGGGVAGRFWEYDDSFEVQCGSSDGPTEEIASLTHYDDEPEVFLTLLPDGKHLAWSFSGSWEIEGQDTTRSMGALVNLKSCEVVESSD